MNMIQIGSLLTVEEYVPRLVFDLGIFLVVKTCGVLSLRAASQYSPLA